MKKLVAILGLFLLQLCMSLPAQAEGVWQKSRIAAPEMQLEDWSGSYLGLSVLWLYDLEEIPLGVGATIGVRKHFPNNLVLGAELDLAYSGFAEQIVDVEEFFGSAKLSWLGSARLTAGYAMGVFMPYVSAGWAIAGWQVNWENDDRDSGTVNGFVWGGGVETKLTSKMSLKLDWSRYEFGSVSEAAGLDLSQDVLSMKLNLRF